MGLLAGGGAGEVEDEGAGGDALVEVEAGDDAHVVLVGADRDRAGAGRDAGDLEVPLGVGDAVDQGGGRGRAVELALERDARALDGGPAGGLDQLADEPPAVAEADLEGLALDAARALAPAPIVYAVPGSPLVAERTVELLRLDTRVDLTVVPGLSFLDLAWERLAIDPVRAGVRLVDAEQFGAQSAVEGGRTWWRSAGRRRCSPT